SVCSPSSRRTSPGESPTPRRGGGMPACGKWSAFACNCHTTRLGRAACSGGGGFLVRPEGEEAGRQGEDEAQPVPARRKGRSALREVPFATGFPTGRLSPDGGGPSAASTRPENGRSDT